MIMTSGSPAKWQPESVIAFKRFRPALNLDPLICNLLLPHNKKRIPLVVRPGGGVGTKIKPSQVDGLGAVILTHLTQIDAGVWKVWKARKTMRQIAFDLQRGQQQQGRVHRRCYYANENYKIRKRERETKRESEKKETVVSGETSFGTVCSQEICQCHAREAQADNKLSKLSFEFTKFPVKALGNSIPKLNQVGNLSY